jgi:translation initiation factor 6 (eIF-6)
MRSRAVIKNVTDAANITVKFKKKCKLLHLRYIGVLNQNAILIQRFLQNLCAEPLRDKCDFKVTAVTIEFGSQFVACEASLVRLMYEVMLEADNWGSVKKSIDD